MFSSVPISGILAATHRHQRKGNLQIKTMLLHLIIVKKSLILYQKSILRVSLSDIHDSECELSFWIHTFTLLFQLDFANGFFFFHFIVAEFTLEKITKIILNLRICISVNFKSTIQFFLFYNNRSMATF